MYPKVKARGEEEEGVSVAVQGDKSDFLLRVFDSFSLEDGGSSGNEHGNDSTPQARIPESYVPITPMPSIAVSKGPPQHKEKNVKEIDLDHRTNIRASPIPRPRAVLSSPDNDGVIGNRNKLLRERQSVLKTSNSGPGTVAQGKTFPKKDSSTAATMKRIPKESGGRTQRIQRDSDGKIQRTPKEHDCKSNTERTPKESDGKIQLNEKLAKEPRALRQRPLIKKGKPMTGGIQAFHSRTWDASA